MTATTTLIGILARAARRPRVLASLCAAAWRFRARGWWRRAPFLPVPPREYVGWRIHTAYGDGGREPTADELERYVRWANRMHSSRNSEVRVL
jgi:hypothetical protein